MSLAFLKDGSFLELENGSLNFLSSGSNSIQVSAKNLFLSCHSDSDLDYLFSIFASISLCQDCQLKQLTAKTCLKYIGGLDFC